MNLCQMIYYVKLRFVMRGIEVLGYPYSYKLVFV